MLKRENLDLLLTLLQTLEPIQKKVHFAEPILRHYPTSDTNTLRTDEPNRTRPTLLDSQEPEDSETTMKSALQQQDPSKIVNVLRVSTEPLLLIEEVIQQESRNDENVQSVI